MRSVSASGQRPAGKASSSPTPRSAPSSSRPALVSGAVAASAQESQLPPYPPTSSAANGAAGPPARSRISGRGVPGAASTTPGRWTAPRSVSSTVPGSSGVPTARNQPAPWRAISATWAKVSALASTVGRPSTPRSAVRCGETVGRAGPPDRCRTMADASPATYRSGPSTMRTAGSRRARCRRSSIAAVSAVTVADAPRCTQSTTSPAPTAPAAATAPSTTRCGARAASQASFSDAGSLSAALTTTTGRRRPAAAVRSLRASGKAPPPRPVSPAAAT